ncbi:glycoside hydrolase family 27 protein [Myriangium duriaei CBS 260.36]|uniref:Alpha-galactosidase n=1 Tax=Myriangium duriaei CBS 260.36 TaxID=1168546 RepID=A0A9P4MNM8_9PEZI|nr:glycoside hydrolase family 27 protein [Myriangium duriaei CBS 260.36]
MGWDNWNAFGCSVSEDLLTGTAQRMSDIGLKDAGYNYVILDDCWSAGRYENDTLKPDFTKFPNGMAHVADAVHNLGMKYGMYSSAGLYTCGQYAASLGKEETDANTFAEWGVDYLKYDNCYNNGQSGVPLLSFNRYNAMSMALNKTGRPILYSMCQWGEDGPWNWAMTIANSWRMSGDITDTFNRPDDRCPCTDQEGLDCKLPGYHCSMMNILNKVAYFLNKGQPGAWNDLDMLEVGNGGMTDEEYKTHFTMWAAVKSPLIIGTDVRYLNASAYSIYMNPAIIALNQDPLGTPVQRRWRYYVDKDQYGEGEISLFVGPLYADNQVVILLNAGNSDRMMNATLADVFVDSGGAKSPGAALTYDLFDLWGNRMDNATAASILSANASVHASNYNQAWLNTTQTSFADALAANNSVVLGKQVGTVQPNGMISAMVPRHGVMAYRLRPQRTSSKDEL